MTSTGIDIVLGTVILAIVVVAVVGVIAFAVWESVQERRYSAHLDDVEAHMAPLRTGSTGAEKRMLRFHREHGLLLLRRASDRTRRVAAALDARKRPGWLLRHRPALRRPVFTGPVAEPPLEALPEGDTPPQMHTAPVADGPELLTAPLPEVDYRGLADATEFGFLTVPAGGPDLPPAPGDGGASPIGDALTAEMGIAPQPRDDEDSLYAPDNTMWSKMRDELFAMLAQDGEVAS